MARGRRATFAQTVWLETITPPVFGKENDERTAIMAGDDQSRGAGLLFT